MQYGNSKVLYKLEAFSSSCETMKISSMSTSKGTRSILSNEGLNGYSNWKDKLIAYDGMTIGYDAIGNPISYNGWSFAWQQGRQLKSMSGNGYSLDFTYKVICEDNAGTKLYYTYDNAGTLISMNYDGANYYYVRNAQNDVIGLIDQDGSWVVKYTYDSWGKLISIDGSLKDTVGVKNPYRYRGYRYDTETGLYYLNSRYYNPDWGRFINADSFGGNTGELLSHNVFVYCKNNPINMRNSNGKNPILVGAETGAEIGSGAGPEGTIVGGIIGGLVGLAALGILALVCSPSNSKPFDLTIDTPRQEDKMIYGYVGTNPGNFVPTQRDVATNTGLSFSTIPKPGVAMTTIGALNATGVVTDVQDGPEHVSVRPVGATIKEWRDAGSSSIWTTAIKSVVIKWGGRY